MSYDLLVFDPAAAPKDRAEFLSWWEQQSQWAEPHGYDDPAITTPALRGWFLEMILKFPAMNGPFASDDVPEDEATVTDYSVGSSVIYAGFAWSKMEPAYEEAFSLAAKHRIGFFDASSEKGEVWFPGEGGKLVLLHSG